MLILDTDHLTVLQRRSEPAYSLLQAHLRQASEEIYTTIISVEEQMRGWLAVIGRAKKMEQEIVAYRQLRRLFAFFGGIPVLDFYEMAAERFAQLRHARLRLGTMDLKITAIALSQGATLLSRNLIDFGRVPGLQVKDWTQAG
jgi:tRNA(fMet)-specific endonuclease VapC